ncbi:hypothetical protein SCHPADRAFT_891533 [Schizopora paradoxa]|uniref:Uncharacterized protein n=1 Tax=Schizopora paradoxa TaxID=27342 RepID=A0A0H2RIS4_9AGAM|nr:hypothetical protein SCHPADRAFT_891533 [Schizopora paradoxa]
MEKDEQTPLPNVFETTVVDVCPRMHGVSFNVDAGMSSFMVGEVNGNHWSIWFRDMETIPDSTMAELTEGLVILYTLGRSHTNIACTHVVAGLNQANEFKSLTPLQRRVVIPNEGLRMRIRTAELAIDPRCNAQCLARSICRGHATVKDPNKMTVQTWMIPGTTVILDIIPTGVLNDAMADAAAYYDIDLSNDDSDDKPPELLGEAETAAILERLKASKLYIRGNPSTDAFVLMAHKFSHTHALTHPLLFCTIGAAWQQQRRREMSIEGGIGDGWQQRDEIISKGMGKEGRSRKEQHSRSVGLRLDMDMCTTRALGCIQNILDRHVDGAALVKPLASSQCILSGHGMLTLMVVGDWHGHRAARESTWTTTSEARTPGYVQIVLGQWCTALVRSLARSRSIPLRRGAWMATATRDGHGHRTAIGIRYLDNDPEGNSNK